MQPKKNFRKNGKESTGGCFPAAAPHKLTPLTRPSGSCPVNNGTNSPIPPRKGTTVSRFLAQAICSFAAAQS